jgi:hypothetical protein
MASNVKSRRLNEAHHSGDNTSCMRLDIDYSLDIRGVYRAFAKATMRGGATRQVLEEAIAHRTLHSSDKWPSWVPDWRLRPIKDSLHVPKLQWNGTSDGDILQLTPDVNALRKPHLSPELISLTISTTSPVGIPTLLPAFIRLAVQP